MIGLRTDIWWPSQVDTRKLFKIVVARHVRFGSKADVAAPSCDVRFTPKSGHWNSVVECPLCAKADIGGQSFNDVSVTSEFSNMPATRSRRKHDVIDSSRMTTLNLI